MWITQTQLPSSAAGRRASWHISSRKQHPGPAMWAVWLHGEPDWLGFTVLCFLAISTVLAQHCQLNSAFICSCDLFPRCDREKKRRRNNLAPFADSLSQASQPPVLPLAAPSPHAVPSHPPRLSWCPGVLLPAGCTSAPLCSSTPLPFLPPSRIAAVCLGDKSLKVPSG